VAYGVIIAVLCGAVALFFPEWLHRLFSSDEFMPHATCYLRNPQMIRLHVTSDMVIGLSYVSISCTLAFLVWKASRDIPFHWMFLAFGLFIITCGFTHFMEVWTVWKPLYWLAGYVKAICAIASIATAIALFPLLPQIFALLQEVKLSGRRGADLEIANQELEAFAYSVSHDLRAPLRAMRGLSDALVEDHIKEISLPAQDYLNKINEAAGRMDELIKDILELSRVSRGTFDLTAVEIGAAVQAAKAQLTDDTERSGAVIRVESDLGKVRANPALLTQVIANLLSNSIKFMTPGRKPEIAISSRSDASSVTVTVADNGIGIEPEYQPRIFKMFERLHPSEVYPGTGIGLTIVQKAMARMNGSIALDSTPGQGTHFHIKLPLA
jgi:signal transduction histidine kinase